MKSTRSVRRVRRARRGIAALITVASLSAVMAIGALLLKASLTERKFLDRCELQTQAQWLTEAGLDRAAAKFAASPQYKGETWKLPASRLESHAGDAIVQIEIKPVPSRADRRIAQIIAEVECRDGTSIRTSKTAQIAVPGH